MHSRCTGAGQEHFRLNLWRTEQGIVIVLQRGKGKRCKCRQDLFLWHVLLVGVVVRFPIAVVHLEPIPILGEARCKSQFIHFKAQPQE
jgi:hypothetical protein